MLLGELNTQNLESLKPHPGSEILIFPLNFGNLSSATAIRVPDARLRIFMHNNNNTEDFVRYVHFNIGDVRRLKSFFKSRKLIYDYGFVPQKRQCMIAFSPLLVMIST